jgi:RES domain-containing protein
VSQISIDPTYQYSEIGGGTTLYRLTAPTFAGPTEVLNGAGANSGPGRYHRIQQPTTYASDNVLLCFAEKLYYMNKSSTKKLLNNSFTEFRREAARDCSLVIFKSKQLKDLVHIASSEALHRHRLNPSSITHPEQEYTPLQDAADTIRSTGSSGLVYLSARHSMGLAVALFGDRTGMIDSILATVRVRLSLVSEDRSTLADDARFDPTKDRISYNWGHFAIDVGDYSSSQYLINPAITVPSGYISTSRTHYRTSYPKTAIK